MLRFFTAVKLKIGDGSALILDKPEAFSTVGKVFLKLKSCVHIFGRETMDSSTIARQSLSQALYIGGYSKQIRIYLPNFCGKVFGF